MSCFLELRLLAVGCSLLHLNLKLDSSCVLNGFKIDYNMGATRNTMLIKLSVNIFYWKLADCKRVDLKAKLCACNFSARRNNVF